MKKVSGSKKTYEERFKNKCLKDCLSWDNWVFGFWEEEFGAFDIEESWAEYKEYHASRIPLLDRIAILELVNWLSSGDAPRQICELAAESIVCDYMEEMEDGRLGPRNTKVIEEARAIKAAAADLERALSSASGKTLGEIQIGFFPVLRAKMNWPSLGDEVEQEFSDLVFAEGKRPLLYDEIANPRFLSVLSVLSRAARYVETHTPKDRGGAVSGQHDRDGVRAKTQLVRLARNVLDNLGLPYGSQKNGPVSKFATLVHRAATGQPAPWADKYAGMVPSLERKEQTKAPTT